MDPKATNSAAPVIDMVDVTVTGMEGSKPVTEHVNWMVYPGDYWVIGGLQGSGKSDLLFLAGGLMPPAGGTYRLFGEVMPFTS